MRTIGIPARWALGGVALFLGGPALAQSLCGIGASIPPAGLICVEVSSSPATNTENFVGSSPLNFVTSVGDYSVAMTATFVVAAGGIEVALAGRATRNANTGGNDMANVTVVVEGGRSGPLPGSDGALSLSGTTSGVGQVVQGGAAGYFTANGQDLIFDGFNQNLTIPLFGPGDFAEADPSTGTVAAGAVAVQGITVFQLNDVGETIDIPSGTGAGEVFPAGSGRGIVLRAPPEGNDDGVDTTDLDRLEHWTVEQFRNVVGSECDAAEHWHIVPFPAVSLEGTSFEDTPNCGLGKEENTPIQTVALIETPTTLDADFTVPAREAMFVVAGTTLTVPEGVTLTVNRDASLAVQGTLAVEGSLVIGPGSRVDIDGVLSNAGNSIDNSGTLNIWGTGDVNNQGATTNLPGGTIQNFGSISNSGVLCNDGTLLDSGAISGDAVTMGCDLLFRGAFE